MKKLFLLSSTLCALWLAPAAAYARGGGHGGGHHGGGHHGGGHHGGHHGGGHHAGHHTGHHGGHGGHHANHHHSHNGHHVHHHHWNHNGNGYANNGWHNGWHHGYANGWGAWAGMGALGAAAGWMGGSYAGYYNPYWSGSDGSGANYSQPIASTTDSSAPASSYADTSTYGDQSTALAATNTAPSADQQRALADMDSARASFKEGNYAQAQDLAQQAIKLMPDDPALHEFSALALFAEKDYKQAAAAVYAVLSAGPGWNEETVRSLYSDPQTYANQIKALQDYVQTNPNATDALFLLAYHHLTAGDVDQARSELERVTQLLPQDHLAAQLVETLGKTATNEPAQKEAASAKVS